MTSAERRIRAKHIKQTVPKWVELNPLAKTQAPLSTDKQESSSIKIKIEGIEIELNNDYPIDKLASLIERLVK
jgi:hypothetical protein